MPPSTRRQAQARNQDSNNTNGSATGNAPLIDRGLDQPMPEADSTVDLQDEDEDGEEEEDDDQDVDDIDDLPFPPPGLKEISSLASWTVSTAKPGNGVAALRSPDLDQFWQSDGPQPHVLSIHFFKLVEIMHMRIFLDFAHDESYTPTKIQLLAGMASHDMIEFAEMTFEQPQGWVDVDFSNVGPIEGDETGPDGEIDWSKRPPLRAFLVQVKILENHQNGKDTHLRAVQIFARDEVRQYKRPTATSPRDSAVSVPKALQSESEHRPRHSNNVSLADWMLNPDLR